MTRKNTTNVKNPSATKGLDGQHAAINVYIADVERMWKTGTAREHTYRFALVNLLETLIPESTVVNDGAQIECGAPDCTIMRDGLAVGYVEAKDIGVGDLEGKKTTGNKEQLDRYKASLDNSAFTDYLEFLFYSKGQLIDSVRIAENAGNDIRPLPDNFGKFLSLIERLGNATPQTITSPTQLAQLMAGKARLLQVAAQGFLSSGKAKGSTLWELFEGFKRVLMPNTTPEEFSDIYAQTLTYGMFAARLHDNTPEDFSREEAARLIPKSNPFLRKLFNHINSDIEKEIEWAVDDIVRLFAAADVVGIMKDYGKSKKRNDPMIHFYEDFLNAYDAGLRKDRGVWYTPLPIVRFIVRAVDDILTKRFGIADGIASRDTVQISVTESCDTGKKLTKQVKKTVPRIQILDPAMGTGTFIAECINRIYGKFLANKGMWPGYVTNDLIPRLNGFELLMAPYTMAHIKMDRTLAETGYEYKGNDRFNIFLTNSLEKAQDINGSLFDTLLGTEANAANAIKRDCPVMVVIGNPPYSGISQNNGDWIKDLLKVYKKEPGGKEDLKERKHWLNDDYVKFIRLAQDYVERRGEGILAYINNHGLLDNPTFRGMRWHLLDCFDEIYVLNLHGNSMKHEKAADGGKDENVFSITVGTAINIFVKTGKKKNGELAKVHYADLWGTRKDKFAYLESKSLANVGFTTVTPTAPMYFFVPQDEDGRKRYSAYIGLDELFTSNVMGIVTARDALVVDMDKEALLSRIKAFCSPTVSDAEIRTLFFGTKKAGKYLPGDTRGWRLADARRKISRYDHEQIIKDVAYRPFDVRNIYYSPDMVDWGRERLMSHFLKGDNLGLCCIRICSRDDDLPVFVTDIITDKTILSSKDNANVFPLYLYHDTMGKVEKVPNFNKEVFERIADGLKRKPSPEELFDYIYAVLHTPEYRERYREFLKVDFPRIPYPTDAATFKRLAKIGGELRETHLLKIKPTTSERNRTTNFPKAGSNTVEDVSFVNGKVYINDEQYFDHVPEEAWSMFIGGYQPAQKWLKDRKGRTLTNEDIDHYQEIIFALSRTRAHMQKLSALSKDWLK